MSEFHVIAVKVNDLKEHPNADSLELTNVFGYSVIVKKGDFKSGDLAIYVPIDSVVPDTQEWSFLNGHRRIDAKRLRGVYSQGLLVHVPEHLQGCIKEGEDVTERMNITKYEPPVRLASLKSGDNEKNPDGWVFVKYTDIEGMRRYNDVLVPGDDVVITEKLDGSNMRFVHDGDKLWVGSHNCIKKEDYANPFWQTARNIEAAEKLKDRPYLIVFGEMYGNVQKLTYGLPNSLAFRAFDVFDVKLNKYLDFDDAYSMCSEIGLQWVPILYEGPWTDDLKSLADGNSTLANHIKEGIVVRSRKERYDNRIGRVVLKLHGEQYLLTKNKRNS